MRNATKKPQPQPQQYAQQQHVMMKKQRSYGSASGGGSGGVTTILHSSSSSSSSWMVVMVLTMILLSIQMELVLSFTTIPVASTTTTTTTTTTPTTITSMMNARNHYDCRGFFSSHSWKQHSKIVNGSSTAMAAAVGNDNNNIDNDNDDALDMGAFKARKEQQQATAKKTLSLEDFDGYALRDVIYEKWGLCYDVDFNRVDSFGFRNLYLNVLPFHLGGRRFRHESELDYLCHLQAVVEILQKYNQLEYILAQIQETDKKPRAGTSPLVAVPLRLDLTREQVTDIIGY